MDKNAVQDRPVRSKVPKSRQPPNMSQISSFILHSLALKESVLGVAFYTPGL
jgi:hypothetical protein